MTGYYLGVAIEIIGPAPEYPPGWITCQWPKIKKPCLHWADQVKTEPWGDEPVDNTTGILLV